MPDMSRYGEAGVAGSRPGRTRRGPVVPGHPSFVTINPTNRASDGERRRATASDGERRRTTASDGGWGRGAPGIRGRAGGGGGVGGGAASANPANRATGWGI